MVVLFIEVIIKVLPSLLICGASYASTRPNYPLSIFIILTQDVSHFPLSFSLFLLCTVVFSVTGATCTDPAALILAASAGQNQVTSGLHVLFSYRRFNSFAFLFHLCITFKTKWLLIWLIMFFFPPNITWLLINTFFFSFKLQKWHHLHNWSPILGDCLFKITNVPFFFNHAEIDQFDYWLIWSSNIWYWWSYTRYTLTRGLTF